MPDGSLGDIEADVERAEFAALLDHWFKVAAKFPPPASDPEHDRVHQARANGCSL
jgi:hypothetical protein